MHHQLSEALADAQAGIGASELHGSMAGFLCAGGLAREADWLRELALEGVEEVLPRPTRGLVDRLYADCAESLGDPELGFDLLLPPDEAPLNERALALVEWCRGFLGGLGLSGANVRELAGDGGEVLKDLTRIAGTRFEDGETDESDEEAYAEVVEYVRVGVLLLHAELSGSPRNATRH